MAVDPIEVVLYLTARDATYGILDGFSSSIRGIGTSVNALSNAMAGQEEQASRLAAALGAVEAAQTRHNTTIADAASLADLQMRGITDLTSAHATHAAAIKTSDTAMQDYLNTAGDISSLENQAATLRAQAALTRVPAGQPGAGRFVSTAARQALETQAYGMETQAANLMPLRDQQKQQSDEALVARQSAEDDSAAMTDLARRGSGSQNENLIAQTAAQLQLNDARRAETEANTALNDAVTGIGPAVRGIALPALGILGLGIAGLGAVSESMAETFDADMQKVRSLAATQLTQPQLGELGKQVLGLAGQTGQSPDALAQSEYTIASAGNVFRNPADALTLDKLAGQDASAAGMKDETPVINALTTAMAAYGATAAQTAEYNDILTQGVVEGKAEYANFATALSNVVAPAEQAGVSFQELTGFMSGLSATLSPQEASDDISALLRKVEAQPSKQALGLSRALDIPIGPGSIAGMQAADGNNMNAYLQMLVSKTGGNVEELQALLGSAKAVRVVENSVLQPSTSGAGGGFESTLTGVTEHHEGAGQRAFDSFAASAPGKQNLAKAGTEADMVGLGQNLEGLKSSIETTVVKPVGAVADRLNDGITAFNNLSANAANSMFGGDQGHTDGLNPFSSPDTTQDFQSAANKYLVSGTDKDLHNRLLDSGDQAKLAQIRPQLLVDAQTAVRSANPTQELQTLMANNTEYATAIAAMADSFEQQSAQSAKAAAALKTATSAAAQLSTASDTWLQSGAGAQRNAALAQARAINAQAAAKAQNIKDYQSGQTPFVLANAEADLSTGITEHLPTGNLEVELSRVKAEIAKIPTGLTGEGAKQKVADLVKYENQVYDEIFNQMTLDAQTTLQALDFGGSIQDQTKAQQALAQLAADNAAKKYTKDSAQYRAAEQNVAYQGQIGLAAQADVAMGSAAEARQTESALGVPFGRTRATIAAETTMSVYDAQHEQATAQKRALDVTKAQDQGKTEMHAADVQQAQNMVNAAQTNLTSSQFYYQTVQEQKAALASWTVAALRLADLQAGGDPVLRGQLEAAVKVQGAQTGRGIASEAADRDVQAAQLMVDASQRHFASAAQQKTAVDEWVAATDAYIAKEGLKGPALTLAKQQEGAAADTMYEAAATQPAQNRLDAAQTHLTAAQFTYQSVNDQKEALAAWTAAALKLADAQAHGNPEAQARLEGAVQLQTAQTARQIDTEASGRNLQAAQLMFDASVRHFSGAQMEQQAIDLYVQASQANIAKEGLKGPALALANLDQQSTVDGMHKTVLDQQQQVLQDQLSYDEARHAGYATLRADADAIEQFTTKNAAGLQLSQAGVLNQNQQLENTIRGMYAAYLRPPVYVDRPYEAPVGTLSDTYAATEVLLNSPLGNAQQTNAALLAQVAALQSANAALQAKETYQAQEITLLQQIAHNGSLKNQPRPPTRPGGSETANPRAQGVNVRP